MTQNLFLVFLGGGAGSALRYLAQTLIGVRPDASSFPWATFTVNVAGCFLIGLFYALSARMHLAEGTRLLLTAGLCGGFTTFSAFGNETVVLLRSGCTAMALAYAALSVAAGVGAVFAGAAIVRQA